MMYPLISFKGSNKEFKAFLRQMRIWLRKQEYLEKGRI
jgi:hypothetical protein